MKYIINSFNKGNFKKVFVFIFSVMTIFIFYFFSFNIVNSGTGDNMSGFAWGADDGWQPHNIYDKNDNGIKDSGEGMNPPGGMGWLSFNSTDGGGSVNYGVTIDTTNGSTKGDIIGYAWAGNSVDSNVNGYGWLKFGELSGFPTGGGTQAQNANLNGNNVKGWARFCSAAKYPSTCEGTESNSSNGGWDGWVSLSGTGYGVTLSGNTFSGYAWGGNVVGWIDFSKVKYNAPVVLNPTVTITANNFPDSIVLPVGNSVTIRWSGNNLIDNSTGCRASGSWSGQKPSPSGSFGPLSLAIGNYEYKIECLNSGGTIWSPVSEVTVNVTTNSESVTLKYTPVAGGPSPKPYTTTLTWTTIDTKKDTCVASGGWTGNKPNDPSGFKSEAGVIVTPGPLVTYTIKCEGKSGSFVSHSIKLNEKSGKQKPKWEWE